MPHPCAGSDPWSAARNAASAEQECFIGGSESHLSAASIDATDAAPGRRSRRLRLARRRRGRAQELTGVGALFGVAQLVRAESDLPTVLALIARTISDALGFGTVVLNLYRREWDDFCVTTIHGDEAVQRALLGSTYGWGSWRRLLHRRFLRHGAYFIKHGEFDWTTDIGDRYVPEREVGEHPEAWHPDDELFVPLYGSADELLGIISVGDPASDLRPSDQELQLLVGLAGHAAQALAAAQSAVVAGRHRAALEQLMHISSSLTQTLSNDSILQAVCEGISQALGFQKVCVHLVEDGSRLLVTRAATGWRLDDPVLVEPLSLDEIATLFDPDFEVAGCFLLPNEAARERVAASQVVYESEQNGRGPHGWNHHWLVIPLRGPEEEVIGVIWADEPEDRLLPTEERLQALRIFANQAASALTLAAQFQQMRYLADHDPLTQLPNRRAFMRELERRVGAEGPLALVVLDLDGFKSLNDRHGHASGDESLVRVARLLRTELREGDEAFRIGGDEFAILLPGATRTVADGMTERLADLLERNARSSLLRVDASFGIATRADAADATPGGLLRAADEAMYRAKHERKLTR
jgi:diguanylate cyclase (GGDEF)-like protein